MNYSKNVWNQLKGLTVERLMKALKKDGWVEEPTVGATIPFRHPGTKKIVVIHYHPKKTYRNPGLLKGILDVIGWSEKEMKNLKLIK